jgi:hypothetical protein
MLRKLVLGTFACVTLTCCAHSGGGDPQLASSESSDGSTLQSSTSVGQTATTHAVTTGATSLGGEATTSAAQTTGPRICDGRPMEVPNMTCLPADPADRLPCTTAGNTYDGRFAGYMCCEGLKYARIWAPMPGAAIDGLPPGCVDNSVGATFVCLACGNGVCEPMAKENGCTCPEDCSGDAGSADQ